MALTIEERSRQVSYRQLLRFFAPLGFTPFLVGSTHSIVNAAVGRLPSPELSLAMLTVVKGLTNAVKASNLMSQQSAIALIDGKATHRLVMRFLLTVCAALSLVLWTIGFTPFGEWVFRRVLGLSDPEHIARTYQAMRLLFLIPFAETLRNAYNGIAISLGRTFIMPVATGIRMAALVLFLWWAVAAQSVTGLVAGSLTWVVGIAIEAAVVMAYLIRRFGSFSAAAQHIPKKHSRPLRVADILRFFLPLGVMITIAASLQPVIQSGLARAHSPTETLAAYGVAWGLVVVLSGPMNTLHQTVIVFTSGFDDPNWPKVRRFSLAVGAATSATILAIAYTSLGRWLLADALAAPPSIVALTLKTLGAFAVFPMIQGVREAYWGILMRRRATTMIGGAKAANLLSVVSAVFFAFGPFHLGELVPPPVVGAVAFTLGEAVETFVIVQHARRRERTDAGLNAPAQRL